MLAIHLNRDIGDKGFNPNRQTHLAPILATAVKAAANRPTAGLKGCAESAAPTEDAEDAPAPGNGSNGGAEDGSAGAKRAPKACQHMRRAILLHALPYSISIASPCGCTYPNSSFEGANIALSCADALWVSCLLRVFI